MKNGKPAKSRMNPEFTCFAGRANIMLCLGIYYFDVLYIDY